MFTKPCERLSRHSLLVCLLLFCAHGQARADVLYDVYVVEALDPTYDLREAYVTDINDGGRACGFSTYGSFYAGFVWDEATGKTIIPVTFPRGINELDQVVGDNQVYDIAAGTTTTITGIGSWYIWPRLVDINENGIAVGYIEGRGSNSDGVNQIALIWDPSGGSREPGVPAARDLVAINNANVACGNIRFSAGDSEAYVYDVDTGETVNLHDLLSPSGLGTSEAADINEAGVVAGEGWNGTAYHAFVWSSQAGFTFLPGLDGGETMRVHPGGIDNAGHVVGWALNGGNQWRAFIWDAESGMRDLNTLVDAGAFILDRATAINEMGWVVGTGHVGPGFALPRGFVLRPLPAAASVTAAGGSGVARLALQLAPGTSNPASGSVDLVYTLAQGSAVHIGVYDVLGRRVARLLDGTSPAGVHRVAWDGRDQHGSRAHAGVYFVKLDALGSTRTQRLVLCR